MTPDKGKAPTRIGTHNQTSIRYDRTPTTPSQSSRWKTLERTAARKLGGQRIVREDLFQRAPDVLVPDFGLVVEAKAYRRFAHHSLLEISQRKYCRQGEVPALVTKHSGQRGEYTTVPLDWLAALLDEVRAARKGGV